MPRSALCREFVARLRNITHCYGRAPLGLEVLRDVELDIRLGDVTVIKGHSGSGKTTLLSILGLLLRPTRGSVQICGDEMTGRSESQLTQHRLRSICFVFQGFNLLPALTAAENVQVGFALQGVRGRIARSGAMDLLERVGLRNRSHHKPAQLSSGQQQRVAIARALASPAPLLLADEPTASLDSRSALQISDLLRGLAKRDDRAVVVVTHDPRVLPFSDRVIELKDGSVAAGSREDSI